MPDNTHRRDPNGCVYLIFNPETGLHKIGASVSPHMRRSQISSQSGVHCELVHSIETNDIYRLEEALHTQYADRQSSGEWFRLTTEDVAAIRQRGPVAYTKTGSDERYLKRLSERRGLTLPRDLWDALDALSKEVDGKFESRSVTWLATLAVKQFLDSIKGR